MKNLQGRILLNEQVYKYLKSAIINGEFLPGERLKEEELSALIGVSRTPIREAINKLKLEGLLTSLFGGGVKVSINSADEISEIFDMRLILETYAIRKTIDNISEEGLKKIEENIHLARIARRYSNIEKIIKLNDDFHKQIIILSGNNKLFEVINNMNESLTMYRKISMQHPLEPDASLVGHEKIFECISSKNKKLAIYLMREHIKLAQKLMIEQLELFNQKNKFL
ncbi:MAG: hypothetical protein VR72_17225 [Clostridiaceae bacterium BRH_c20a]|nr:MAG: hypothetical protein VR72_17225 [Clostridiaceae bacterium BRH_c20a]